MHNDTTASTQLQQHNCSSRCRNEDPVREAELNIRTFKRMHRAAVRLLADKGESGIEAALTAHDAMAALELLETMDCGSVSDEDL